MSKKTARPPIAPLPSSSEVADHINRAFKQSDIIAICHAIGDATRRYHISDVAKQARIDRPSVYRAFGGRQHPNLSTVLGVLDAMGFQLKVIRRRGQRVGLARTRASDSS